MSKEIKVGILGLVAAVIIYFGFNYLKGNAMFSTVNTYYMVYKDIGGLTVSNPVVVNGLNVGKVRNLELLQDGKENNILVTINVEDKIEIGDGTTAILKSSDLLGGKMILLKLGPNNEVYPSGDTLRSSTEKSITEELQERATPVLANVDTTISKLRGFIDADDKASFKNIIKNMETTSILVKRMTNESRQNANLLTGNLIELSAQLRDTEKRLGPLIEKMSNFGDSLNTLDFDNTLRMVDNSIQNLDSIVIKLNDDKGTMGKLINDKKLYDQLNVTLTSLDSVLLHFEENPKHFLAPLGKEPNKKSPYWDKWHGKDGYKTYKKTH